MPGQYISGGGPVGEPRFDPVFICHYTTSVIGHAVPGKHLTSEIGMSIKNVLAALTGRHRNKLWAAGAALLLYTLLGFFLAPWLVKKIAIDTVREQYGAGLSIDQVAINPYVLSLRIDGLAMDDPAGKPLVAARTIYVNLQLSSIFRLAPTFAEIRLDALEATLARAADGTLNARFLVPPGDSEPAPEHTDQNTDEAGMPRLIVRQLAVNDAILNWTDQVPAEPVVTTFGPMNAVIHNLNTLPGREGRQEVVIANDTAGSFGWSGTLQLNPLRSAGRATIQGSHMPLISAYLRDEIGFDIVQGQADAGLDYSLDTAGDGSLHARVDNFGITLGDVLVRTHKAVTADGAISDRDVLAIPSLRLAGGALRWPERTVSIDAFEINDSVVSLYRNAAGALNIVPTPDAQALQTPETPEAPLTPAPEAASPWSVSLGRFQIAGMSVGLLDDSVTPPADMGIDSLGLTITDISNETGASFPTRLALRTRTGGTLQIDGKLSVLPEFTADLAISAEGLSLAEAHPYLKPLADVNLDSGKLATEATLQVNPRDILRFAGDVAITDFLISETDEGSRLGSWDRLALKQVVVDLGGRKLGVSEVRVEKPYADVFVASNGSVNLGRIKPGAQTTGSEDQANEEDASATVAAQTPADTEPGFNITVGRVLIVDGAADFADQSLPLPFQAGIAKLNGGFTTIATGSTEPSEVTLEGKVDEFGLLQVSGTLTPFDLARNTDVRLHFQNVEVPTFTPYTVAFAGREIASGKLDLQLGYKVKDSELTGENKVVLRDFTLGDKVEHPGAMSLPLDLAVALLKGPDGAIDIDLPVRGNVDDPEFRYGRVIGKALVQLVVKIVASPFALLGKLVGSEPDELDHIDFIAGRADLTPPEQERIAKLVQALGLRPELLLELGGVVDREVDGLALRTAHLDALIETRIDASPSASEMYTQQRARAVEAIYRESSETAEPTLAALRTQFTSETLDPQTNRPVTQFDELAYTAELRRQLIEQQTVTEEEMVALASARAENVGAALVETKPELAERIRTGTLKAVKAEDDGVVRMDVTLTSSEG